MAPFTLLIILAVPLKIYGYFLTMITGGQVFVVNEGDNILLDCKYQADYYNLFDFPVLWKKTQRIEETQLNIMGNINEPYVSAKRFKVSFTSLPPRYQLDLSISEITLEDSGNYTCEVRGPQSIVLGFVTHYVFVRAPVHSMKIVLENSTSGTLYHSHLDGHPILSVAENEPTSIRCITHGGYPPPNIEMFSGKTDITEQFDFENSAQMTGRTGLRVMHYVSQRYSNHFVASANDDGKRLKCISTVPGLKPNMSYVRLSVKYSPKITCYSEGAFLGEKNVHIRCEVVSKPRVSALFWILDVNGTTLAEGEVVNEYWTLVRDRSDDVLETQLFLRQAKEDSFHPYTLVAENTVAVTTYDVILFQKRKAGAKQPLSHSSETEKNTIVRNQKSDSQREGHVGYVYNLHSNAQKNIVYFPVLLGWILFSFIRA